jgi:hypothetical protein
MKTLYLLLISITFIFSSCSKVAINKRYKFVVENKTMYTLDKVNFDWCQYNNFITLVPNSISNEFTLTYKVTGYNLFGSGSLCVNVLSYSDSISNFENDKGYSIARSTLDINKINKIIITEINDTSYHGTNRFNINFP